MKAYNDITDAEKDAFLKGIDSPCSRCPVIIQNKEDAQFINEKREEYAVRAGLVFLEANLRRGISTTSDATYMSVQDGIAWADKMIRFLGAEKK